MSEVQRSFNEVQPQTAAFTNEVVAGLPVPLQKYLLQGGYIDKPMMGYMYLDFKAAWLSIQQGQAPVKIRYEQYNFAAIPDRHAFIDAKMFGMHLINGKDTLMNGTGSMTIRLAKHITLGQSVGREMNRSQLVSTLADAVLMPSLFVKDYIEWTPVDDTHAEGTITWGELKASGAFTFNADGEIIRFDTNDRYQDNNGEGINLPWTVEYGNYQETDRFRRPGTIKIYWHEPDGSNYTYFESDHYTVSYAVEEELL